MEPGLSPLFSEKGADCTEFIRKDGSYGRYGTVLKHELETTPRFRSMLVDDETKAVENDEQLKEMCPGLQPKDRVRFFVWTVAAIAWAESKCDEKKVKKPVECTNGNCVGLLQLEEQQDDRYWRGEACDVRSVAGVEANLKCGLDIIRGQYSGKYGAPPGLRKSYWQKLRNLDAGGEIKERVASFPGCKSIVKAAPK